MGENQGELLSNEDEENEPEQPARREEILAEATAYNAGR